MSADVKVPPVRIQMLDEDFDWRATEGPAALLAVLGAAKQEITGHPDRYADADLLAVRDALDELDAVVGRRIREGTLR